MKSRHRRDEGRRRKNRSAKMGNPREMQLEGPQATVRLEPKETSQGARTQAEGQVEQVRRESEGALGEARKKSEWTTAQARRKVQPQQAMAQPQPEKA